MRQALLSARLWGWENSSTKSLINLLKVIPRLVVQSGISPRRYGSRIYAPDPYTLPPPSHEMLWMKRESLSYTRDWRAASRQQHCLSRRISARQLKTAAGASGNVERGRIQLCRRKDGSFSLLLPLHAVSRAPMLSHCPSPLGHLCQLLIFFRDFLCIFLFLQLYYIYSFEARDSILCLFGSFHCHFLSRYLMKSWNLIVGSDSLRFSCSTSHSWGITLCAVQLQEYISLGHLQ